MTVAMPSHRRKGKHGVVNTQVQSHPLLRRGFGTSVPFHYLFYSNLTQYFDFGMSLLFTIVTTHTNAALGVTFLWYIERYDATNSLISS